MENHPIPQDITGFQFKLIGNLTVRQFSYLAAGAILAAIFIFILPIPFIVGLFFGLIFLGIGAAFAFVPIDGRHMDVMVGNFFKALFAPTKYIYQKTGGDLSSLSSSTGYSDQTPVVIPMQQRPMVSMQSVVPMPQPVPNQPPPLDLDKEEVPAPKAPETNQSSEQKTELEKMLTQIQSQKEDLEKQLANLQSQLNDQKIQPLPSTEALSLAPVFEATKIVPTPKTAESVPNVASDPLKTPVIQPTPEISPAPEPVLNTLQTTNPQVDQTMPPAPSTPLGEPQIAPQLQLNNVPANPSPAPLTPTNSANTAPSSQPTPALPPAGLPIPEAPNLITGIVRDPRGNPLQNILVEVKDQDGNPVRAFKTNGLGRFASATSLANGKYLIIFEDPKGANKFDPAQIDAIGNPLVPIEIVSVDAREELRRELFK